MLVRFFCAVACCDCVNVCLGSSHFVVVVPYLRKSEVKEVNTNTPQAIQIEKSPITTAAIQNHGLVLSSPLAGIFSL